MSTARIFRHEKSGLFYQACDTRVIIQNDERKSIKNFFNKIEFICDEKKRLLVLTLFLQTKDFINASFFKFFIHLLNDTFFLKENAPLHADEIKRSLPWRGLKNSHDFFGIIRSSLVKDSIHTHDPQFLANLKLDPHSHIEFRNCNPFDTLILVMKYIHVFQTLDLQQNNILPILFMTYRMNLSFTPKNLPAIQQAIKKMDSKDANLTPVEFVRDLKNRNLMKHSPETIAQKYEAFSNAEYENIMELIRQRKYARAANVGLSYLDTHPTLPEVTRKNIADQIAYCQKQAQRQNRCRWFSYFAMVAVAAVVVTKVVKNTRMRP